VLGPLVVSVVTIQKGREGKLSRIGVRDSKMLTRKKREYLYDEIMSLADDVGVYRVSESEINKAMASGMSLNELEALHFARLIDASSVTPQKIYLDSPDVISEKFGVRVGIFSKKPLRLSGRRQKKTGEPAAGAISVVSEHKADIRYPVVSCASIIAKVTRDNAVDEMIDDIGIDVGSGYPSDKKTVDAIKANLQSKVLAPYMRDRWKTMKNIRQLRIGDFLDI
jgi:ribonuclease HII